MNNAVTQRFVKCIEKLKELNVVKSNRQFAMSLDYLPQGLSEMFKGRRDVPIELLRRAIEKYGLSGDYIFTGTGSMLRRAEGPELKVLSIVADGDNEEYIVHVPVAAQAGYADQYNDPTYVFELPRYKLPYENMRGGTYRSFDVCGNSMEPTLQHGDKVVCSYIEPNYWDQAIKDGQMYVVVTTEGVVVKRLINRLRSDTCIDLVSDNRTYDTQSLCGEDIREVWMVRLRMTPYLDVPRKTDSEVYERLERQNRLIEEMNSAMQEIAARRVG